MSELFMISNIFMYLPNNYIDMQDLLVCILISVDENKKEIYVKRKFCFSLLEIFEIL